MKSYLLFHYTRLEEHSVLINTSTEMLNKRYDRQLMASASSMDVLDSQNQLLGLTFELVLEDPSSLEKALPSRAFGATRILQHFSSKDEKKHYDGIEELLDAYLLGMRKFLPIVPTYPMFTDVKKLEHFHWMTKT
jgi:hypothetical protein